MASQVWDAFGPSTPILWRDEPVAICRYGKQALSAMYRTIVGRRDAGESGVTPDFMAEALAERELAAGTPEWSAARLTAFKVRTEHGPV